MVPSTATALACILLFICTSFAAELQIGARFPLGVQVGHGGNCTQASEHGYIRFNEDTQIVEVCRETGWTEVGSDQAGQVNGNLDELLQRVATLEGEVIPPLSLSHTNALLQSLVDAEYCNKRGEFNVETKVCSCWKSAHVGYWSDASFCTSCDTGYTGATCQTDINECSTGSHSCSPQHNCVNTDGSYECECMDGYQGDSSSCADINECTGGTHSCDANAACTNTQGSFSCQCNEGYNGDGFSCEEGPAFDVIASHGGWTFYKVPVSGTMTATNVRAACLAAGLVAPCPGDSGCTYTNTNECTLTSEVGCGSPMLTTSQVICGSTPQSCSALNGVYIYMKDWSGGSACGVYNGSWCSKGATVSNHFAFCGAPN